MLKRLAGRLAAALALLVVLVSLTPRSAGAAGPEGTARPEGTPDWIAGAPAPSARSAPAGAPAPAPGRAAAPPGVAAGSTEPAAEPPAALVPGPPVAVVLDGRPLAMTPPAFILQDRTLVPVRFVTEALGATVSWDPDRQQVGVRPLPDEGPGVGSILLTIGSRTVQVAGRPVELDVAPQIVADRTFVPLRFVAETLGLDVGWKDAERTVVLTQVPAVLAVTPGSGDAAVVVRGRGLDRYQVRYLREPDRVAIDFPGARMTPLAPAELPSSQLPPQAADVSRVRTGQYDANTARVVLDLKARRPAAVQGVPGGVAVRLPPYVTGVNWTQSAAATRVEVHTSQPAQATATVDPSGPRLTLALAGVVPGPDPIRVTADGKAAFRTLAIDPAAGPQDPARVQLDLPYYVGHRLQTADGGRTVVLELDVSPVSGRQIWLDPGHGGRETGAIGRAGTLEKDVNLAVARLLRGLLVQAGADVRMTRDSDVAVGLYARPQMSSAAGADAFVSIHSNAAGTPEAGGTETYYWSNHPNSRLLAECIQRAVVEALGLRDRGVRTNNYVVLRENRVPAALVELAFLSNPAEERLLADPAFQRRAAEGIREGLMDYFRRLQPQA